MPITDEDIKVLNEKLFIPVLAKFSELEKKLMDLETQFPSMSKKHAGEAAAEAKKLIDELKGGLPKPDEKKKDEKPDSKLDAALAEIEKLKKVNEEAAARADKEGLKAAIAKAASKFKIVPGLEDYAQGALIEKARKDKNGNFVLAFKEKIGQSDEEIEREVSIETGVTRFFAEKKAFLVGDVKDGSGAGSGNQFVNGVRPTWAQLKANATLLREWQDKEPEYVLQAQNESLAKLSQRQG